MRNDEFKIEKGIPMPPHLSRKKTYYFEKMEVGDSVFLKGERRQAPTGLVTSKFGFKFTVRKMDGGIRVWRIA